MLKKTLILLIICPLIALGGIGGIVASAEEANNISAQVEVGGLEFDFTDIEMYANLTTPIPLDTTTYRKITDNSVQIMGSRVDEYTSVDLGYTLFKCDILTNGYNDNLVGTLSFTVECSANDVFYPYISSGDYNSGCYNENDEDLGFEVTRKGNSLVYKYTGRIPSYFRLKSIFLWGPYTSNRLYAVMDIKNINYQPSPSYDVEKDWGVEEGGPLVDGALSQMPTPDFDSIKDGLQYMFENGINYHGTDAVMTFPAIEIPAIGPIPKMKFSDPYTFNFKTYFNIFSTTPPSKLLTIARILFSVALVIYGIKDIYDTISLVLSDYKLSKNGGDD